jgi:hypothetical protein
MTDVTFERVAEVRTVRDGIALLKTIIVWHARTSFLEGLYSRGKGTYSIFSECGDLH